ncbi:MAG: Wzz/FepE/Etk N-terminal domain-containing protein [Bacillota bacterium]
MDPVKTLQVLLKARYLIIAVIIIAILTGTVISLFIIPPTYEATTVLLIGKVYIGSYGSVMLRDDIHLANSLMRSYEQLLHSRSVAEKATEVGKLDVSPNELLTRISTHIPADSQIIELTARSTNPILATNYANATAKGFALRVEELMGVTNVSIVDRAVTPGAPAKPNLRENLFRSGFIGLLTALIIVFSLAARGQVKEGS